MILIVGPYLRGQEHSDCANHPMLPVVWGDDCDALDLLLVASYEPGVGCESRGAENGYSLAIGLMEIKMNWRILADC